MRKLPLYQVLAGKVAWAPPAGTDFVFQRDAEIRRLVDELPSGSGWDNGTKIDLAASRAERLVLYGSWHHMNENGYYDGWTDHSIIVTPSLAHGFTLRITGPNRRDIKDYLHETFDFALRREVEEFVPYITENANA
jgi:hypothetical protein